MRVLAAAVLVSLLSPAWAQPAFEPTPLPPGCTSAAGESCPLLAFTRRVFAPALGGVTIAPAPGEQSLFLATTSDPALPAFRLIWIEEQPMAPERAAADFSRALTQPGRTCGSLPRRPPTAIGRSFSIVCVGADTATQGFFHAVPGRQRTTVFVILASFEHGPALLALGDRMAGALAQAAAAATQGPQPRVAQARPAQERPAQARPAYVRPRNYDQLQADCGDDRDVARQVAGCEAVLDDPNDRANHPIALNNRGHARERSGDLASALRDYERSVALDPSYTHGHVNRGRVLVLLDRGDEALAAFDRGVALGDNGWSRLERGRLLAARGDLTRALADLDEAARRMPDEPDATRERDRVRGLVAQRPQTAPSAAPAGPNLGALAEQFLTEFILGGAMTPEMRRSVTRPTPNVVRFETPPVGNEPGFVAEVEARSCTEVIWRDRAWTSRLPVDLESTYDLSAMARIWEREGPAIRMRPGSYGQRVDHRQNGASSYMHQMAMGQLLLPGTVEHGDADRLLQVIERHCAAVVPAAPTSQAPTIVAPATSAEALAGEYGRRLVDEFTAILAESTDRSCLASRGIAPPTPEQARDLLTRYGQRAIELYERSVDQQAVLQSFAAAQGDAAAAELTALARRPEAQEWLRLMAPTRSVDAADVIVEHLGRHLLIRNVRLSRSLSPIVTGAPEPLAIRERVSDAATAAAEQYAGQHAGSREMQRFLQLIEAWGTARQTAIQHAPPSAYTAFEGIVPELRAFCIRGA